MTDTDSIFRFGAQSRATLPFRRGLFSFLVVVTVGLMTAYLNYILSDIRFSLLYLGLLLAFILNIVWTALAFWNALIGFVFLCRDSLAVVSPLLDHQEGCAPIAVRTAVAMTLRNDDTAAVFARIRSLRSSLDKTGWGDTFDYFILSDSSLPDAIDAESRAFDAWRALPDGARVTYRHRDANEGFKPGNVRDFCARWGANYSLMLLLDADSLMTGETVVRLVRMMQSRPQLGILQSLIVGVLSPSLFARVFEFGHRHALRCSIVGSAWWQGDRCQFWGHNAIIRLAPFSQHCEMPYLPGRGPFSGHIICHDQIEASFMHRAGYEVRVLPQESGSNEGIPPTLLEFMNRNHRWCQGNIKNLKVIGAPGLAGIDRFHLGVVAQRFIAWLALVVFVALAGIGSWSWPSNKAFPTTAAFWLYISWIVMFFAPKFLGIANAILYSASRYGGRARLIFGGFVEFVFSMLMTPVTMVGTTIFMGGLLLRHELLWCSQRREGYLLPWRSAFASLWLETSFGLALLIFLVAENPLAVVWFAPFWLGLVLAVPFAVLTSLPRIERWAVRWRICAIPEEINTPPEIRDVLRIMSEAESASFSLDEVPRTPCDVSPPREMPIS